MSGFFQRFGRDISGIGWLALSCFLGLCLVSFSPDDPSFHSLGGNGLVSNYCGYVGSFLSDLLFQFFGVTSWSFFGAGVFQSYRSFKMDAEEESERGSALPQLIAGGVLVLVCSALIGLYFPSTKIFSNEIYLSGLIGSAISQSMSLLLNPIGASVVLWTVVLVLILFLTEKPFSYFLSLPMSWAKRSRENIHEKFIAWREKRAEEPALESPKISLPLSTPAVNEEVSLPVTEPASESSLSLLPKISIAKPKTSLFKKVKPLVQKKRTVENWELPKVSMLKDSPKSRAKVDEKEIKIKARLLVEKLEQFNVKGEIVGIKPGPAVTLFEFKPSIDVRLSKITELENDLSLALSSESVRIIAPIPGRDVVGIETANSTREVVFLKDVMQDEIFWDEGLKLPIVLGQQANGEAKVVDLRTMPHIMVAGSTGSGKSVFTVAAIVGLLFRHSPKTLRFILIDPKQVDLAFFDEIPHLLLPPILEPKKAVSGLKWAVREMEKRYRSLKAFGARKLEEFNEKVAELSEEEISEHRERNLEMEQNGIQKLQQYYFEELPYIVIVIEEFGDLMAVEKGNLEHQVVLLAQKARAAGIHLYLAMQSPRKDVVTGLIKTNIPGRVSFKVTNKMDSRIILDDAGAERLLAVGDMLYLSPGVAKPARHHGPFITNEEIAEVAQYWSDQGEPEFDNSALRTVEGSGGGVVGEFEESDEEDEYDEMYDRIVADVATMKEVSASLLQRKYKIGYPRAARLVEIMEREQVVGPANGSKPRQVLINNLK